MGKIDLRQIERFVDRIEFLGYGRNNTLTAGDFVGMMQTAAKAHGSALTTVYCSVNPTEWSLFASRYKFVVNGVTISVCLTPAYDGDFLSAYTITATNEKTHIYSDDTIGVAVPVEDASERIASVFNAVLK